MMKKLGRPIFLFNLPKNYEEAFFDEKASTVDYPTFIIITRQRIMKHNMNESMCLCFSLLLLRQINHTRNKKIT